ncbi:PAS domain-containing protein [Sphingomonas sp. DT-51]|uniref:PAS domain-containing protein n=1 Tax=Sphingomonas sp. DT-51 TaxID=3396165 RepID=UPI003F1E377B
MRATDWAATPLGVPSSWPQPLKTLVGVMLGASQPMFVAWGEGRSLLYNAGYAEILGNKHPAALGRDFLEVWHEIRADLLPIVSQAYAGEPVHMDDIELIMERNGYPEETHFAFFYAPVRDEDGSVGGLYCACTETTAQVLAERAHRATEAALRASEARLAFLDRLGAATAPLDDADAVLATTTRLLGEHLNLSVCAYADMDEDQNGFSIRGDWAAPGSRSIVGHYSLADFGKLAVENLSAGLPLILNDNLREIAPDEAATFQNIGIAATICMPLVKNGRLTALMAIHDRTPRVWTEAELSLLREVTERSWAHVERVGTVASLRESEARFRLTADAVPQIVWITDAEGRTEFFNKQWSDYTGIPYEPTTATAVAANHVHPEDAEATMAAFEEARRTGTTFLVEHRIRSKAGHHRWFLVRGEPFRDPRTGEIVRWFGASVDIHDRKLAEARLREMNATLEARVADALAEHRVLADVIDGTDIFVQVVDREYNWLAINRAAAQEFARIFGVRRPKAGDNMLAMLENRPDARRAIEAVWSRALGGEEFVAVDEFGDPSLHRRYYEMRFRTLRDSVGRAVGAYQFVSDVTDRLREQNTLKEAQEALRQSQKMEAMGQLTGGVAHDFNNLLTPIIGSLDLLHRKGIGGERERRLVDGALQSAERAKTLVQRLLAFARRQPLQPMAVDLGKLIAGMANLIASTSGPQVKLLVDTAPDLPAAMADPHQLEMAILNLAVNARDAMPDGGTLTIAAKAAVVGTSQRAEVPPGRYVRLSVADTGTGMDADTLRRAVEPFFSTKGVGKGTGLGLSMVHGLAAQLGGALDITSKPGLGTCIELWLPASAGVAVQFGQEEKTIEGPAAAGTALLVDDEDLVRVSTADMLADLGYSVVEVGSAEEALRLLEDGQRFDILVTDHLMPGMTGTELARRVREHHAKAPVLVVSGYAEVEGIAPDLPRLTKPFRQADLAAKLSEINGVT